MHKAHLDDIVDPINIELFELSVVEYDMMCLFA